MKVQFVGPQILVPKVFQTPYTEYDRFAMCSYKYKILIFLWFISFIPNFW